MRKSLQLFSLALFLSGFLTGCAHDGKGYWDRERALAQQPNPYPIDLRPEVPLSRLDQREGK